MTFADRARLERLLTDLSRYQERDHAASHARVLSVCMVIVFIAGLVAIGALAVGAYYALMAASGCT